MKVSTKTVKRTVAILTMATTAVASTAYAADGWTQMQTQANKIATMAREMGLPEDNQIITEASRIWWAEQSRVNNEAVERQEREAAVAAFLQEHEADAIDMAGVMFAEARGLDAREMSMVCWCILNRYDTQRYGSTLSEVIWAKGQFAHSTRTVSDNGTDLVWLAKDVLARWYRERQGDTEVGRTLPQGYCFYYGNGRHNLFRVKNSGAGSYNFGLQNPY